MSSRLELYHWEPNMCFLKPLIALEEKQVPFTSHWFDATQFEQLAPGFPRNTENSLHLEGEGPTLLHGDTMISGSFFMLEYISEALPGASLWPSDPFERYRARVRSVLPEVAAASRTRRSCLGRSRLAGGECRFRRRGALSAPP